MEFADNVLQSALAYQPLTPEKISITYKRFKEPSDLYDACMPLKLDMPSMGTDIGAYDELMNLPALESLKQEQSR